MIFLFLGISHMIGKESMETKAAELVSMGAGGAAGLVKGNMAKE